jgi:hypothetical protein
MRGTSSPDQAGGAVAADHIIADADHFLTAAPPCSARKRS